MDPTNEEQLAEKIKYLIDHPEERIKMGKNSRELAERSLHGEDGSVNLRLPSSWWHSKRYMDSYVVVYVIIIICEVHEPALRMRSSAFAASAWEALVKP